MLREDSDEAGDFRAIITELGEDKVHEISEKSQWFKFLNHFQLFVQAVSNRDEGLFKRILSLVFEKETTRGPASFRLLMLYHFAKVALEPDMTPDDRSCR